MLTITPSESFRKFMLAVPIILDSAFLEAMVSRSTMLPSWYPARALLN